MSLNNSFLAKLNEICRTCLKGGQLLTYLYDEENNINLVTKLKSCTALQFDKNDQMPDKMCPTCIEELLQAYNFINKCQISDGTLKKYMSNQNQSQSVSDSVVPKIEPSETVSDSVSVVPKIEPEEPVSVSDSVVPKIEPEEPVKTEVEKENNDAIAEERFDIVSDISIKEELVEEPSAFVKSVKKRKREFGDGSKLSPKKKCAVLETVMENVLENAELSNTFSGVGSSISDDVDDDVVQPRKTMSEMGKENFAKKSRKSGATNNARKKRQFVCPVCSHRLGTSLGLLAHLQNYTDPQNTDKEEAHRTKIHLTEQIKQNTISLQCQICRKTCNDPQHLLDHYTEHMTKNKCNFCDKLFKATTLPKHIRDNHTGTHPYKCELCTEKMPDADALQSHKTQLHSAEKLHRCPVCSCTFDSVDELKIHGIRHVVGVPPHKCKTCERMFEDAHALIKHKMGKKCGRIYLCCDCPEIFQDLKFRNLHKTKGH